MYLLVLANRMFLLLSDFASLTAEIIVKRVKARSITFFKSVFSLNFPSACYVQRQFKIVLFTEYLKSPLKETDPPRKMSGLLEEVCLL